MIDDRLGLDWEVYPFLRYPMGVEVWHQPRLWARCECGDCHPGICYGFQEAVPQVTECLLSWALWISCDCSCDFMFGLAVDFHKLLVLNDFSLPSLGRGSEVAWEFYFFLNFSDGRTKSESLNLEIFWRSLR